MAAYRRLYDLGHLQADCREPGSAPGPTLGNRVWATFTFSPLVVVRIRYGGADVHGGDFRGEGQMSSMRN